MELPIIPETHMQGSLMVENSEVVDEMIRENATDLDFGIQTHNDGRVWVCINGVAFLRFKPTSNAT